MTDLELAEEIERRRGGTDMLNSVLMRHQWDQIIAALRRADLAQTEIKGHMRVEDDLQGRIAELEKDAARLDWLERFVFDRHWDGTIGRPAYWRMAGPYRHELAKMLGSTLRDAIDAALQSRA